MERQYLGHFFPDVTASDLVDSVQFLEIQQQHADLFLESINFYLFEKRASIG